MTGKEIMDEVGQLLEATAGIDLAHPNVMQTYKYGTQESMVSRAALPGGIVRIASRLARAGLRQAVRQGQLAWPRLQCQAAGGQVAALHLTRAGSHVLLMGGCCRGGVAWCCSPGQPSASSCETAPAPASGDKPDTGAAMARSAPGFQLWA